MHKEQSTRAHCASRSMPESFVIRRPARSLSNSRESPSEFLKNFILFFKFPKRAGHAQCYITLHCARQSFPPFFYCDIMNNLPSLLLCYVARLSPNVRAHSFPLDLSSVPCEKTQLSFRREISFFFCFVTNAQATKCRDYSI